MNFIKNFLRYFRNYIKHLLFCLKQEKSSSLKKVYFDFYDNSYHRYNLILANWFVLKGYKVYFRSRFHFLNSLWGFSQELLKTPKVYFTPYTLVSANIKFTNRRKQKKSIFINHNYYKKPKGSIEFPYPMFPDIYTKKYQDYLQKLTHEPKKIGLFFTGNTDPKHYQNPIIHDYFKLMDRIQIIEGIKNNLTSVFEVHNNEDLEVILKKDSSKRIVIIEKKNYYLDIKNYLKLLHQSFFFIITPGVTMPLCHNLIETLNAGTIPILEFPELLTPPLVHNENCLSYKGKEELIELLKQIISGNYDEDIDRLSKSAKLYYKNHLEPMKFIEFLENNSKFISEVYLNAEEVSIDLLKNN